MAIFLSFLAAVAFGVADFSGGSASRRISAVQVLSLSHAIGFVLVTTVAVIQQAQFDLNDFGVGAVSGAVGGVGIVLFYRALARGAMSMVTPITAIVSSAVPAIWSAASGEPLSSKVWLGVVIALVAVGLVSRSSDDRISAISTVVLAEAVSAGLAFGMFFVIIDQASSDSAPWPIVGARLVTGVGLTTVVAAAGKLKFVEIVRTRSMALFGFVFLAGALDTLANVLFLVASDLGNLAVVAVITGMYPVITVILARLIDNESLRRIQLVGIGLILVATALIVG